MCCYVRMSYTHSCIKCQNSYEDNDEEAYYCASCIEERKQMTAQIDLQIAARPRERQKSDYQIALEKGQEKGGGLFVRATDLGLFQ